MVGCRGGGRNDGGAAAGADWVGGDQPCGGADGRAGGGGKGADGGRGGAGRWATGGVGGGGCCGEGPDGRAVRIDLVRDGPHAVVAGTTGAGKSELLTTLVLGLALTYPPRLLAVLLVDFKGGTGLPGLSTLPHVVGRLSDLDAAGARRVLLGLGAELRRRERIVARAGVRDVEELQPALGCAAPPRRAGPRR